MAPLAFWVGFSVIPENKKLLNIKRGHARNDILARMIKKNQKQQGYYNYLFSQSFIEC